MRCRLALSLLVAACALRALAPIPDVDEDREECTVGVAAGTATRDGRPLLWKNRDSQRTDNVVTLFADGRWPYLGLCDAGNKTSVWGGVNAAGFCVINSVSRDLPGTSTKGPGNGAFMKLALQKCATVEDFAALLEETGKSGRRTRANFGVIDAKGGAAFFETGHSTAVRFDAAAAAGGWLVRANFATTAQGHAGKDRHTRAGALCKSLPADARLDHVFLIERFCRDLVPPGSSARGLPGQLDARETIHRQTTVAALVFHGVGKDEDPRLVTMWTLLGPPLATVAVPCWAAAGGVAPQLAGAPRSVVCDAAKALAETLYEPSARAASRASSAASRGELAAETEAPGPLRWFRMEGASVLRQRLGPVESRAFADVQGLLSRSRRGQPEPEALLALHRAIAQSAEAALSDLVRDLEPVGSGR